MKYSLGKPKLLIHADDFYDFMSQEASAFFAFINAFTIFLRRLIMLTSLSLIFLVGLVMGAICQKPETAENHRNACYRYCSWTICP